MKLLVHAGMPKTGSSAIQDYLRLHRNEIAAVGAVYPKFDANDHWVLGGAWAKREGTFHHEQRRIRDRSADEVYERTLQSLRTLLEESDRDLAILSHESLSISAQLDGLHAFLANIERPIELHVLAYARPPQDLYASSLQQSLKNERERLFAPGEWRSPHLGRAQAMLSRSGDELVLAGFSRAALADGDVITDFRERVSRMIGIALPAPTMAPRTNASLSAEACAVLQLARGIGEKGVAAWVRKAVRKYDAEVTGTRFVMPSDWLDVIARNNAAGWNAIVADPRFDTAGHDFHLPENEEVKIAVVEADVRRWVLAATDPDYLAGVAEKSNTLGKNETLKKQAAAWFADAGRDLPAAIASAVEREADALKGKKRGGTPRRSKRRKAE